MPVRSPESGTSLEQPRTSSLSMPLHHEIDHSPLISPTSSTWYSPDDIYKSNSKQPTSPQEIDCSFRGVPPPPQGYYAPQHPHNPASYQQPYVPGSSHIPYQGSSRVSPLSKAQRSALPSHDRGWSMSSEYPPSTQRSPVSSLKDWAPSPRSEQQITPRASESSNLPPDASAAPNIGSHGDGNKTEPAPKSLFQSEAVRVVNDSAEPVELPITNDDSSEEIVFTSTAYPGQEWRPASFGGLDQF